MWISRALPALTVVNCVTAVPFDEKLQFISTSGRHRFVAPDFKKGDVRGPCPALNAAANHGYLPHNGVASIDEYIFGVNKVYGMGLDLVALLALYGAFFAGNGSHFSMGGRTTLMEPPKGLLGPPFTPQGLAGSHNKYEMDASPTREDLYVSGNVTNLVLRYFKQLYDKEPNDPNAHYSIDDVLDHFSKQRRHCIAHNPYCFFSIFALISSTGAYSFIPQMMSNHSLEHPDGQLNGDVLKTFFSVKGKEGNFKYTMGHERIPDNWYRRPQAFEYTLALLFLDITKAAKKDPITLAIGGNTGMVNTFTGVNAADLTGGVYNSRTLAENNNFACLAFQFIMQAPDFLEYPFIELLRANREIVADIGINASRGLSCPQLERFDMTPLRKFPGYMRARVEH